MRWFLIDKITDHVPGQSISGIKCFSRTDEFFQDHFPGFPIVPGVLQIEMIAQLCGKALRMEHSGILPVLGNIKSAKFYSHVCPGDQCAIYGRILKYRQTYALAEGYIEVQNKKVSQATVFYGILSKNLPDANYQTPVIKEWEKEKLKRVCHE